MRTLVSGPACCTWILFVLLVPNCQGGQGRLFELRGSLLDNMGRPFHGGNVSMQLSQPNGPVAFRTVADSKGRFKFKKIPAGIYVLSAVVPRLSRTKRTIEIGPSFADHKGRIETSLQIKPRPPRAAFFQVTADQLSVPESARADFEKARQRANARDWREAAQLLRNALQTAPQFSAAWYELGLIDSHEGRYLEAADDFREALRHQPEYYLAVISLGGVLLAQGNVTEANPVNERAVRMRPDDELAHAQLGYGYLLAGRLAEAETHLKRTIALDPAHYFYPQILLADIYRRRNNPAAEAHQLEEFLRLHPDSEKARDVAAVLKQLRSELENAGTSGP